MGERLRYPGHRRPPPDAGAQPRPYLIPEAGREQRRRPSVSVPYSSICSAMTLPIRRTPSRISSSPTPEKLSRIEFRAALVDVGGLAGDEGDVVAERPGQQVAGVDVVGQRRPDEEASLRLGPGRAGRGSARASAATIVSRRSR